MYVAITKGIYLNSSIIIQNIKKLPTSFLQNIQNLPIALESKFLDSSEGLS